MPPFTFRKAGRRWIEFQALPGPEARALGAKSMRHDSLSRPGGLLNAECRLRNAEWKKGSKEFRIPNWVTPGGPAPFCGGPGRSPSGFLFPPMLFARNALAPGPQTCFPTGKSATKVKGGKGGRGLTRRFSLDYKGKRLGRKINLSIDSTGGFQSCLTL